MEITVFWIVKLQNVLEKIQCYQMERVFVLKGDIWWMGFVSRFVWRMKFTTVKKGNVSVDLVILIFRVFVGFAVGIKFTMRILWLVFVQSFSI